MLDALDYAVEAKARPAARFARRSPLSRVAARRIGHVSRIYRAS
jgi:hypothetical protein